MAHLFDGLSLSQLMNPASFAQLAQQMTTQFMGPINSYVSQMESTLSPMFSNFDAYNYSGNGSEFVTAGYDNGAPAGAPLPGGSKNPATIANHYLGRDYRGADDLDNDPTLDLRDVPDNVNCANFVWGCLKAAGLVSRGEKHQTFVRDMDTALRAKGWTVVSRANARPGDVWISSSKGHTELVHSNNNGKITLIGSNNRNPDGTQKICYDTYSGNAGGYFLRAPSRA